MRTFPLLILASLVLAACSAEDQPRPETIRPVLSVVVEPQAQSVSGFAGTIEPQVTTDQAFRLGGTLVHRPVDVGDRVSKGQVLASLETTTLSLAVQSAQANLANAQATASNAASTVDRLNALVETNNASQATLDQAEQQRKAAVASVTQAQARLDQSQEQLRYAQLSAGFDGIVTATGAEVGQVVSAGQMIVTLAEPDARDVVIDVPESFLRQVAIGTQFDVSLELDPATTVAGTLREIAPQADAVTRTFRLKIGLDNPPASFWLGTTASARLKAGQGAEIVLPQTAIKTEGDTTSVWIVDPDAGTVGLVPVSLGEPVDGYVVVEDGVKPGDRVVTAGVNSLVAGQKVRIEGANQ